MNLSKLKSLGPWRLAGRDRVVREFRAPVNRRAFLPVLVVPWWSQTPKVAVLYETPQGRWLAIVPAEDHDDRLFSSMPDSAEGSYEFLSPEEAALAIFDAKLDLPDSLIPYMADRILTPDQLPILADEAAPSPSGYDSPRSLPPTRFRIDVSGEGRRFFDPAGKHHWGPVYIDTGDYNCGHCDETLFYTEKGRWLLISDRSRFVETGGLRLDRLTYDGRSMNDDAALDWIWEHGFDVPTQLSAVADELTERAAEPSIAKLHAASKISRETRDQKLATYLAANEFRWQEITRSELLEVVGWRSERKLYELPAFEAWRLRKARLRKPLPRASVRNGQRVVENLATNDTVEEILSANEINEILQDAETPRGRENAVKKIRARVIADPALLRKATAFVRANPGNHFAEILADAIADVPEDVLLEQLKA